MYNTKTNTDMAQQRITNSNIRRLTIFMISPDADLLRAGFHDLIFDGDLSIACYGDGSMSFYC